MPNAEARSNLARVSDLNTKKNIMFIKNVPFVLQFVANSIHTHTQLKVIRPRIGDLSRDLSALTPTPYKSRDTRQVVGLERRSLNYICTFCAMCLAEYVHTTSVLCRISAARYALKWTCLDYLTSLARTYRAGAFPWE